MKDLYNRYFRRRSDRIRVGILALVVLLGVLWLVLR